MGIRQFAVQHNSACSTCNGDFLSLDGTSNQRVIQFCSLGQYQVSGNRKVDLKALSLTVEKEFDDVILDEVSLRFGKLVVFADGRALIHSKTEKEAISLYDTYIGN